MKPKSFLILIFFTASVHALPLFATGPQWEPLQKDQNIQVFRRSYPGQGLFEFRGIGPIHSSLSKVLALVTDVRLQTEWVEGCIKSSLLEGNFHLEGQSSIEEYYQIQYGIQDVPWPLANRDYIIRSTFVVEHNKNGDIHGISIISDTTSHTKAPKEAGLVRIPKMKTTIYLKPDGEKVVFDFRVLVDPGGVVPHWIVNLVSQSVPIATIVKIRNLMAENRFHQDQLELVRKALLKKGAKPAH